MKLYDGGRAVNPRRVRIFLAEKGIEVPIEPVDIATLQHRTEAFAAINPMRRLPALVLDDGTVIAESMAICRYFEALQPDPPLFGRGALEMALVEMWNRRAEFNPHGAGHHRVSASASLHETPGQSPGSGLGRGQQAARPGIPATSRRELEKRPYIAGNDFTIADITAWTAVDFMKVPKLPLPEELANVRRWHASVSARPSAAA